MIEKIILDMLSMEGVSIVTKKVIIQNGVEYAIGLPSRIAYGNNLVDIERIKNEIDEPYKSTILTLWGVT